MGYGYGVHCTNCGFEDNVLDDYGGIYNYYTYECTDCKRYLVITEEHKNSDNIDREDRKNLLEQLDRVLATPFLPSKDDVKCEYCHNGNIVRITYHTEDGKGENPDLLKRPCPKCGSVLTVDEGFWFDD